MSENKRRLSGISDPSSTKKSREASSISIVTRQKPLQYESRRIILGMIDPILRLQIALRCPSLRQTEKVVPLTLNYLSFEKMGLIVNKTHYRLGIVRDFHPGHQITRKIEQANREGGCKHDLDRYGFRQDGDQPVVLPGDRIVHRRQIRKLKKELQSAYQPVDRDPADELLRLENYVQGTTPPYDSFIQLSAGEQISRAPYTFKLTRAFENLKFRILGGRPGFVTIKRLEVDSENIPILPENLKLKILELKVEGNLVNTLETFVSNILHPDHFRLELLEIEKYRRADFNHPIIQNAKKFVVLDYYAPWYDNNFLFGLPNNSHLVLANAWAFNIAPLVTNWKENRRHVGTCLTFSISCFQSATRLLAQVRELEMEVVDLNERNVSIPVNYSTRINISLEQVDRYRYESYNRHWFMKMEVIAV